MKVSGEDNMEYDKVKHLEFIQNIIKRMADNSLSMKKFCIAIFSAIMVLYLKEDNLCDISYSISCLLSFNVIMFMLLDTYYLYLEKLFRNLYDTVNKVECSNYCLKVQTNVCEYIKQLFSISILLFYGPMFLYVAWIKGIFLKGLVLFVFILIIKKLIIKFQCFKKLKIKLRRKIQ